MLAARRRRRVSPPGPPVAVGRDSTRSGEAARGRARRAVGAPSVPKRGVRAVLLVSLIASAGLLIYLFYALLYPEKL